MTNLHYSAVQNIFTATDLTCLEATAKMNS